MKSSSLPEQIIENARRLEREDRRSVVLKSYRASEVLRTLDLSMLPTLFDSAVGDETESGPSKECREGLDGERRGRYEVSCELGRGGMGRVLEAVDPELRRRVAVKVLLDPAAISAAGLARFVAEAQLTSQLEHPSIVPVYDIGITPDGLLYYVMKKIEGRSLAGVLASLRAGDQETAREWTRHRLLSAFVRACQAVAYAHDRGVLHRDLKPSNIMLGSFGEVLVVDWGVARLVGDTTEEFSSQEIDHVTLAATVDGAIIGTVGYMSPEQARGKLHLLDGRSDVWSLGAILYEILTWTQAYEGATIFAVFSAALQGPPVDPRRRAPDRGTPAEIADVCIKALAAKREERIGSAAELADAVEAFLEGRKRLQQAMDLVSQAEAMWPMRVALHQQAVRLLEEAAAAGKHVARHAPIDAKLPVWKLEDEARELQRRADAIDARYLETLRTALNHAADLPEAHALLAAHARALHESAESNRDEAAAEQYETLLRYHDRGEHTAYLEGTGSLTLVTVPPGAEVLLFRYVERERRLVAEPRGPLGRTPLAGIKLETGSYLLLIRAPGCIDVRYPVMIRRQMHWNGVPPGDREPYAIVLPRESDLLPGEVYVPAGWFELGGDSAAPESLERGMAWADAFAMARHPVTNQQYLAFLDDLVERGREEEALQYAPRERAGTVGAQGPIIYGRDASGRFELRPDADGDIWLPDWPVLLIDWYGAAAYCAWLAERTGRPVRLPQELEWEKATRGVDGRFFPWGDYLDPTWCRMRDSHTGRNLPAPVMSYPIDESPYGVRDLAGNVRDWCIDVYRPMGPVIEDGRVPWAPRCEPDDASDRVNRGGAFTYDESYCRAANRNYNTPGIRNPRLGCRPVRSLR